MNWNAEETKMLNHRRELLVQEQPEVEGILRHDEQFGGSPSTLASTALAAIGGGLASRQEGLVAQGYLILERLVDRLRKAEGLELKEHIKK